MQIKSTLPLLLALSLLASCDNQKKEHANHKAPASTQQAETTKLSALAQQGKVIFASCNACHSQELSPPKAPPMFGVQKHYKAAYPEQQQFVEQLAAFAANPTIEKALMKRPVQHLGLMPPQALPKEDLIKVAHYIYEEKFSLPCAHWKAAVKNAEANGKVDDHIKKDKMKIKRFCSE